jgi:BASS family bile acid:Na+ symporter
MPEMLDIFTRVTVFILMLVVGTDCTWSGLRDALRRPGLAAVVVLGQFAIVPAVMYGCCSVLGMPIAVTGSLMLMSCCPTGSISNTHCYLARGNSSLSVALTTLSCLVAVAATPVALSVVRGVSDNSGVPLIPARPLVDELILMMVLPLLIGGAFRHYKPAWIGVHQRALRTGALVAVVALVTLIISTGPSEVVQRLQEIAAVAVLFTAILLAAVWLVSRVFHLSRDDRWAVLFEWPCRNLAIALVLGVNVLNRPDLARFAAALFVIQAVALLGLTYTIGRTGRVENPLHARARARSERR